jgi:hypothetical protein
LDFLPGLKLPVGEEGDPSTMLSRSSLSILIATKPPRKYDTTAPDAMFFPVGVRAGVVGATSASGAASEFKEKYRTDGEEIDDCMWW